MDDKQRLIRGEDHRGLKGLKFEPISQWWAAQMLRPLPKFGSPLMRTPMRANKARRSSWRSKSAHRATSLPSSLLMWSNISRSPKIFYIEMWYQFKAINSVLLSSKLKSAGVIPNPATHLSPCHSSKFSQTDILSFLTFKQKYGPVSFGSIIFI